MTRPIPRLLKQPTRNQMVHIDPARHSRVGIDLCPGQAHRASGDRQSVFEEVYPPRVRLEGKGHLPQLLKRFPAAFFQAKRPRVEYLFSKTTILDEVEHLPEDSLNFITSYHLSAL